MRRPRCARAWLLARLLLLPLPASAAAQEAAQAPQEELFRPATSGPFVAYTALLPPAGRVVAQPILTLGMERAALGPDGRPVPPGPGETLLTAALTLFVEAPVHPRVSVGGQGTLQHVRRTAGGGQAAATGLGDSLLFARGVLLRETTGAVPETALLAQVKLPTGRAESRAPHLLDVDVRGTGSVDLTTGLNLSKGARPVLLHADLLLTLALPTRVGGVEVRYAPTFGWSLAAEWPLLSQRLALMLEVSGRHQGPPTQQTVRQTGTGVDEVLAGAGLELLLGPNVQLLVGYQRTLWGRNVGAFDTLLLTLVPALPLL